MSPIPHTANPLILYTLIPPSFPVMIIIIQLPARPSKSAKKRTAAGLFFFCFLTVIHPPPVAVGPPLYTPEKKISQPFYVLRWLCLIDFLSFSSPAWRTLRWHQANNNIAHFSFYTYSAAA